MKSDNLWLLLFLLLIVFVLPACEGTRGRITFDPLAGVCLVSEDGKHAVCYNPATKAYTVRATVPGGYVRDMRYDSGTDTWRATLPDGTTAVYNHDGLRFEPALTEATSK